MKNGDYRYQVTVRHDTWYAVEPMEQTQYVLFGAVVIPGKHIYVYPTVPIQYLSRYLVISITLH